MVHGQQLFGPVRLSHRPAMKMVTLPGSAEDTTSFELGPSGRGSLPVMQWSGHHLCCPTPGLALTCSFTDHALSSDLLRVKWEYFLQGRPEADEPGLFRTTHGAEEHLIQMDHSKCGTDRA
ncbi:uncharacterized protein LOC135576044 isoform X2 [Columba livia]|uniref:uncharacterized protein LOC135576044 isoform X2 n=1 Tax=Columba livia TaxID=8932 RepID=UPI0031BBB5E3